LVFCDEERAIGGDPDPLARLQALPEGPKAVLVGPEGGFTPDERAALLALPFVVPLSLGPRVMRADTAAVAVLALLMATHGDWR
jgi:16S rRNA (uracil1498-N3)-methyltransferase